MTKLEKVLTDIEALTKDEFAQLRNWFIERDWEKWDDEVQNDAKLGKLDFLEKEAFFGAAADGFESERAGAGAHIGACNPLEIYMIAQDIE